MPSPQDIRSYSSPGIRSWRKMTMSSHELISHRTSSRRTFLKRQTPWESWICSPERPWWISPRRMCQGQAALDQSTLRQTAPGQTSPGQTAPEKRIHLKAAWNHISRSSPQVRCQTDLPPSKAEILMISPQRNPAPWTCTSTTRSPAGSCCSASG